MGPHCYHMSSFFNDDFFNFIIIIFFRDGVNNILLKLLHLAVNIGMLKVSCETHLLKLLKLKTTK